MVEQIPAEGDVGEDPVEPSSDSRPGAFSALLWVDGEMEPWLPAVARLLELPDLHRAFVAVRDDASAEMLPDDPRLEVIDATGFAHVVRGLPKVVDHSVLLMTAPVLLPLVGLGTATARHRRRHPGRGGVVPEQRGRPPELPPPQPADRSSPWRDTTRPG